MRRSPAFTLIEMVVVLVIVSLLLAFSVIGGIRFKNAIEFSYSINQVVSDIKVAQQLADTSLQLCKIEFKSGKNMYTITKGGNIYKTGSVSSKVQFYGKSYFSFVPSGYTEVGGSGTLFIGGASKVRKIIVSSRGRIRVE